MKRRLVMALRVALGLMFIYAAYTKLRQPWLMFAMSIDAYQLLPEWAVLTIARGLPPFELLLGVLLCTGFWLRAASVAAAALLGCFFGIMLLSYGKGMGIDCGCFGLGEALTPKSLLRDGLLVAASVLLALLSFRKTQPA